MKNVSNEIPDSVQCSLHFDDAMLEDENIVYMSRVINALAFNEHR